MKHCHWSMVMLLLAALVCPARAGIFSKRAKPNPAERVPALITTLRVDLDEHKRVAAAEELRQYDPAMFPEIVPTLADVAQHDPKAGVRLEAIQSLAKVRPISHQAGLALEQATHDEALKVRMQARTLLFQYHLAGYRANKTPDIAAPINAIRTDEPPLAPPSEDPPITNLQKPPSASQPDAGGRYRGGPPAPIVSVPGKPAPQFASGSPEGTGTPAYSPRAKPGLADGRAIRWVPAGQPPNSLPPQPAAVPLDPRSPTTGTVRMLNAGPRPLPSGSAKATTNGPRPLPNGSAKPAGTGPKPLPEGPADAQVAPAAKSTNEPPLAPSDDEGPELSPPN